jgi:hypothetical protein
MVGQAVKHPSCDPPDRGDKAAKACDIRVRHFGQLGENGAKLGTLVENLVVVGDSNSLKDDMFF